MGRYASQTSVSPERSRAEIEEILRRYGANGFMYGWDQGKALVGFHAHGRQVRFFMPVPNRQEFTTTPTGRRRTSKDAVDKAWEQAIAQRWRALTLAVKAKLETVESGIASFEEEFAAYIVLPNGQTLGEWVLPQVAESYETGSMPSMLPALEGGS